MDSIEFLSTRQELKLGRRSGPVFPRLLPRRKTRVFARLLCRIEFFVRWQRSSESLTKTRLAFFCVGKLFANVRLEIPNVDRRATTSVISADSGET